MHFRDLPVVGTRVRIQGLVNSPEFNGQEGSITAWSAEKKRYEISIGGKKKVLIKPNNIESRWTKPESIDMMGGTQATPEETKVCLTTITTWCTSYLSRILWKFNIRTTILKH
jgi:hypothetical protein